MYRLDVHAPGANALRFSDNIDEQIRKRNERVRHYNVGSWRPLSRTEVTPAQVDLLKQIKLGWDSLPDNKHLKMRIEEPNIQFYFQKESEIHPVVKFLLKGNNNHIVHLMRPESPDAEKLLLEGYVLRKKSVEWRYRMIIRDGRYSEETKQQFANYLSHLGDQVKVPENLSKQLDKGGWIWSGYVYLQDPALASMITLIDPNLVSKIEEFKSTTPEEINTTIIQESENGHNT